MNTPRVRVPGWLALLFCVAFAACDSGPKGPGVIQGTVSGPQPLGAVVLEVTGLGVVGFEGQGDTRAHGAVVTAATGRHRVVLIDADGATVHFGIRVEDLSAVPPVVSVVQAAGTDNLPLSVGGVLAVLEEPK